MKWYVYTLTDPRDDSIFYVGKGQRYRMYNHTWLVKRNSVPHNNYKLFNRISEILKSGLEVVHSKVYVTDNEDDAYVKEYELICKLGIHNLCNLFAGVGGTYSGDKHWNFGKTWSDEVKNKISNSKKGQRHTEASKNKIRTAWKNKTHPLKGKRHTNEARTKMSENHADFNGTNNPFFGKTHSEETRKYLKQLYAQHWKLTFPDGSSKMFLGRKEVKDYVVSYNKTHGTKVSAHSLFQYGKNKHGWLVEKITIQ